MFLSDCWSGWKRGNSREPVPDVDPVERESFALCQGRGDDGLGIGLQRDSPLGRISVAKEAGGEVHKCGFPWHESFAVGRGASFLRPWIRAAQALQWPREPRSHPLASPRKNQHSCDSPTSTSPCPKVAKTSPGLSTARSSDCGKLSNRGLFRARGGVWFDAEGPDLHRRIRLGLITGTGFSGGALTLVGEANRGKAPADNTRRLKSGPIPLPVPVFCAPLFCAIASNFFRMSRRDGVTEPGVARGTSYPGKSAPGIPTPKVLRHVAGRTALPGRNLVEVRFQSRGNPG